MSEMDGKVAVVIGGSGAIGAATCRALAAAGALVVLGYNRDRVRAEAIAETLPGSGHAALHARIDDSPSLTALAEAVRAKYGRADVLVNAAGFTQPVPHHDMDALDDALIDKLLTVTLRGAFAAIRAFRPLLRESQGLAITISSTAAFDGMGSNIAYAAAKAGVEAMTKALARALAPEIRIMTVSPGVVDTDFVPGRDVSKIAPTIPLKRVALAHEVAQAVLACATLLPYSTGSTILVDGGRLL